MEITEKEIRIVSGEGEIGTTEIYFGKMTQRAIKSRLTRERCKGDRWARAIQYVFDSWWGEIGINLETNELGPYPKLG